MNNGLREPNRLAMESAVEQFLRAAGLDLAALDLRETPKRVVDAWADEFLDGYSHTPEEILAQTHRAPEGSSGEMVVVTDLHFHSACPHHLLPYQGRAHLAYILAKRAVGFGRMSALLDCFAHRLILQEDLARAVARALAKGLDSPGTACIIEAEQGCLRFRGHRQREARTYSEAYEGRLRRNERLRKELWQRLGQVR